MEEPRDDRALRASDADRDRVAEQLRQAAGDGRLSIAELQDRLDTLYAAKTYSELEPVVADLPDAGRAASALVPNPTTRNVSVRVGGTPVARTAVFGGVDIIVPEDVIAIVDGTAVFGGFDDKVSTSQPAAGAPVVRIGGKAVFGGVSVHRRPGDSSG